jgi:isopentenyldiphosphate isomerase
MSDTEQAVIVDTDDNVLEYRDRNQVGTFDLHRIVAVWIVNNSGQVLIAQRAHTMQNQPGVWGPAAAGTVAAGEDYAVTARRELAEEVGLTGVALRQVGKFSTDRHFGECRMCAVFVGTYNGDIGQLQLQSEEVAAIRWVTVEDLRTELADRPQDFVINMQQVIDCL